MMICFPAVADRRRKVSGETFSSTIEPILNPILVAVFYGETIGATAVIGALLVVGSATVYNVRQAKNA